MTRVGEKARKRAREGLDPLKPGRIGWVHGTKLAFMQAFKDDFLKATELGKVQAGRFYNDVADRYLKKYRYHTGWADDLYDGQEVASDVDEDEDVDALPVEEGEARSKYYDELRTKIGAWFRGEYGGASKSKKTQTSSSKELFDKEELAPAAPKRGRITHFYSGRFYEQHIKVRFEARWAQLSSQPTPPGRKPPVAVTVRNEIIKECWEAESKPFQEEVIEAWKKEHAAKLVAHETAVEGRRQQRRRVSKCNALDNAGYYLQPFVNAIRTRFGMNVSLMMCGPIPERGGAIEMHSVHAGISNGLVPRIWPDYDRAGFEATRRSFRQFSENCFSMEERQARSLNGMPEATVSDSGSGEIGGRQVGGSGGNEDEEKDEGGDDEGRDGSEDEMPLGQRDLATALEPDLAAEVALMVPEDRERFERCVVSGSLTDAELRRQNAMARNCRALAENGFRGPQSDVSKSVEIQQKRLAAAAAGGAGNSSKRKRAAVAAGPRRRTCKPPPAGDDGAISPPADDPPSSPRDEGARPPPPRRDDGVTSPPADDSPSPPRDEGARPPPPRCDDGATSPPADGSPSPPRDEGARPPPPRAIPPPPCRDDGAISPSPRRDNGAISRPPSPDPGSSLPLETMSPCPRHLLMTRLPLLATTRPWFPPRNDGIIPPPPPRDPAAPAGGVAEGSARPRPKPAYKGAAVGPEPEADVWVPKDNEDWPEELQKAIGGFGRLREWGGDDWIECVERLINFERKWGFPGKGLPAAPREDGGRPTEVATFMRGARKWGAGMALEGKSVGPRDDEGSFAHGWWNWWRVLQPERREIDKELGLSRPNDIRAEDWTELAKTHGRNGLSLVVGCLLWWGDAAVETKDPALRLDWLTAVQDVSWALAESMDVVGILVKKLAQEAVDAAKEQKARKKHA
ncbi:hypothetical protein K438DRAFT_1981917 [Mycena galopus ATCC 62051]|nr:hypothetical protein K438DRAFT_1981917 [Mycena galopus ATCC 62051]